ncbi:MAG: hypothetical protein ABJB98_01010 [Actinomycetota bacterium]
MTIRTSVRPPLAMATAFLLVTLVGCGGSTAGGKSAVGPTGAGGTSSSASASSVASDSTSADATTAASGPVDACKLVTSAEAQAILGKPVRPAKTKALGPTRQEGAGCTYESTDFANGTSAGQALVISFFPHSQLSQSLFDTNYRSFGDQAVPGLGDSAWYLHGMLNVYYHGSHFSVSIVSLTAEATLAQLTPVARTAIPRI